MFTMQCTKDGGMAVAMASTATDKTHNPALTWWFKWGKKEEYAKPRTKGIGVSYGKIGLTTVGVTQDLLSGMPLVL